MRFLKNVKGQAAIFVVLIFQVLFILFAMSINVAMVTYDKINLQNSLDLAAYYGAKKQAEVLNAMAHINYQMRQNWKLLAWRYRILGTLAQPDGYYRNPNLDYWCPQNADNETQCAPNPAGRDCRLAQSIFQQSDVYGQNYCDKYYFVCISHDLWKRGIDPTEQVLCTKEDVHISGIQEIPDTPGPLGGLISIINKGVGALQKQVSTSCPLEGALNWLMTQLFMTHFRLDQKDRKVMMMEIYNRSLKVGKDLDGESIFEGAKNVFCGNLSQANKKNLREICASNNPSASFLKPFSSFKGKEFKDIFEKINVWPVLQFAYDPKAVDIELEACKVNIAHHYMDGSLKGGSGNVFDSAKSLFKGHGLEGVITKDVETLFRSNLYFEPYDQDPLRDLTLSFFKKKDQVLYYGLRVEFDYKSENQIFSLNLSEPIKFRASAFAKPFGANFGPQPEQSDPLIPVFPKTAQTAPSKIPNANKINPFLLQPNYSRFPGDKWGLIDKRLHDNNRDRAPMNFLNKHHKYSKDIKRAYTMGDYFHLTLYKGLDDPLARTDPYEPFGFTRMMELMAVYPNLYDISYYSILGNYHQTYFEKICKLLTGGSKCHPNKSNPFSSTASQNRSVYIRGDFGWPDTEKYIEKNFKEQKVELSIAPYFLYQDTEEANFNLIKGPAQDISTDEGVIKSDRSIIAKLKGRNWPLKGTKRKNPPPLSQGNLFYPWLARSEANPDSAKLPDGLLSSWTNPHPLNYEEYELDPKRFLKCGDNSDFVAVKGMPVPSACAAGGRSGYSVKLISCEAVKDFSNKPPDIDDYCPK